MKSVVLIGALVLALALLAMTQASALWHWLALLFLYFWGL